MPHIGTNCGRYHRYLLGFYLLGLSRAHFSPNSKLDYCGTVELWKNCNFVPKASGSCYNFDTSKVGYNHVMDHLKRSLFILPGLASSRLRERQGSSRSERMRPTAEPETGFEKVYIEPSVQSWLMHKRFLTCLCSTNGSYIFDIFTSALVIF